MYVCMYGFDKNFQIFPCFYIWQDQPAKCVRHFLESKKASLDYKKQKVDKVEKSGFFIFPKGLVHGFGKKFEIFPCFHFSQKNSQQNVFGDILDILESKKAFFKSHTCSDRIKKL